MTEKSPIETEADEGTVSKYRDLKGSGSERFIPMILICWSRSIGVPGPVNSTLFMPNMLDMKLKGSFRSRLKSATTSLKQGRQKSSRK